MVAITHHWWSWWSNDESYIHFYPTFQLPPTLVWTIHKINRIFLISQHILVESLVSNMVIDLSKYKHAWKMFELGCLHQLTVIALHRLDRRKLLNFVRIPITVVYFKDRKWIPKTVYCISCSVVCKIFFAPNSPIFRIRLAVTRRRTQAIAKRFAFHANAIKCFLTHRSVLVGFFLKTVLGVP